MPSRISQSKESSSNVARLFGNVQFLYELILAQLELGSLRVPFEATEDLSNFKLLDGGNDDRLRKRVAYFETIGDLIPITSTYPGKIAPVRLTKI